MGFTIISHDPSAITQAGISEYVSHYSAPGGMHAGFEHYRAFPQGTIRNKIFKGQPYNSSTGGRSRIYSTVGRILDNFLGDKPPKLNEKYPINLKD